MDTNFLTISVAYAALQGYRLLTLQVKPGTTIGEAIEQSGIVAAFPEIDLSMQRIGIFSKLKTLAEVVKHGDRIEIYRPLLIDPKEARHRRVAHTRKAQQRAAQGTKTTPHRS